MIAVALAGLADQLASRHAARANSASRRWWIPLAAIPVVVLFLLFPISRPLWHLLPEMRFLQFPWRWLEAVEAPWPSFSSPPSGPRAARAGVASQCCAVCAAVFLAVYRLRGEGLLPGLLPRRHRRLSAGRSTAPARALKACTSTSPLAATTPADRHRPSRCLPCRRSHPSSGQARPRRSRRQPVWSADQGSCQATFAAVHGLQTNPEHREIRAITPHAGYLVLRLLSYPAWRVRVNGQLQSPLAASATTA